MERATKKVAEGEKYFYYLNPSFFFKIAEVVPGRLGTVRVSWVHGKTRHNVEYRMASALKYIRSGSWVKVK